MYKNIILLTNNNFNDPFLHSQLLNIYQKSEDIQNIKLFARGKSSKINDNVTVFNYHKKYGFLSFINYFILAKRVLGNEVKANNSLLHIRGFVSGVLFYFLSPFLKVKFDFIYDPRGAFILERKESKSWISHLSGILFRIEESLIKRSLFTIVETENLKEYFIKNYNYANKYILCYNSSSFRVSQEIKRIDYDKQVKVCYIGSLNFWHPLEEILRLFEYIEKVMGKGNVEFYLLTQTKNHQKFEQSLKKFNLSTVHIDFIKYEEVESFLEKMDICVSVTRPIESIKYSSSIKIADYLLLNKRIIMTKGLGDFDNFFSKNKSALLYGYGEKLTFSKKEIDRIEVLNNEELKSVLTNEHNFSIINEVIQKKYQSLYRKKVY